MEHCIQIEGLILGGTVGGAREIEAEKKTKTKKKIFFLQG